MNNLNTALSLLPAELRHDAEKYSDRQPEEFRLRLGRTPKVLYSGCEFEISSHIVTPQDIYCVMEKSTGASMHTAAAAMSGGYIDHKGIRIGICGTVTSVNGQMNGFRNISSLALRIPRECKGICSEIADKLKSDGFENTLIIARPGGGKTTALRELIRCISDSGIRVGVADERNELSGSTSEGMNFDLGQCADVIVGATKLEASMMLLRGMNPQIIAMDEITRAEDIDAIGKICGCGVGLLASVHSSSTQDLMKRELYRDMLKLGAFKYAVVISFYAGRRHYSFEELKK